MADNKTNSSSSTTTLILNFKPSQCMEEYISNYPGFKRIKEQGWNWCAVEMNKMDKNQKTQFQIDVFNNLVQEVVIN